MPVCVQVGFFICIYVVELLLLLLSYFQKSFLWKKKKKKNNKHAFHWTVNTIKYTNLHAQKSNYNNNVKSIRCFTFLLRMIIIYCAPLHAIRIEIQLLLLILLSIFFSLIIPISLFFLLILFLVLILSLSLSLSGSVQICALQMCRHLCSNSINFDQSILILNSTSMNIERRKNIIAAAAATMNDVMWCSAFLLMPIYTISSVMIIFVCGSGYGSICIH